MRDSNSRFHSAAPRGAGFAPRLGADTRGAVLVVGIVLGALLTGGLFYLASVGDAIVWRESLQDTADAAAFENAVWNARGMNVIVSVNIVMSMVLSVLVVWRIVMIAVAAAIGISAALCTIGVGCAPAVELTELEVDMLEADPRVADTIIRILAGVNVLEMGIASAVPVLGVAASTTNTGAAYADASSFAASASLLPNINIQGIENAVTCLGGGGEGEAAGAEKPGAGASKPGPGGTKPGAGATKPVSKPDPSGGGGSKPDLNKSTADPCAEGASAASSKPTTKPSRLTKSGSSGAAGAASGGSGGASSGGASSGGASGTGPLPDGWDALSTAQDFVSMRMGMPVSLPVQDGDFSVLCGKAMAFPINNLAGALEKGLVAAGVDQTLANFAVTPLDLQGDILNLGGEFLTGIFCAPLGTAPVSVSKMLDKSFKTLCEVDFEKNGKTKPASGGATSGDKGGGGTSGATNLVKDDEKFLDADGVPRTKVDWIKDCAKKKKTDMNKKLDGGLCAAEKEMPETDCGKPAQVWDWSPNGSVFMRSFAGADRPIDTRATDSGLEVADGDAVGNVRAAKSDGVSAHAEMYFECEDEWGSCSDNAMWAIRWRARLRRVQPLEALLANSAGSALGGAIEQALKGVVTRDFVNNLVLKIPGVWTELDQNPLVGEIIKRLADDLIKDLHLDAVAEAAGGLAGKVLDLFGTGFHGPTTAGDLTDDLFMSEKAPQREDALRSFIRAHAGRSATIH